MSLTNNKNPISETVLSVNDLKNKGEKNSDPLRNATSGDEIILPNYIKTENTKMIKIEANSNIKSEIKSKTKTKRCPVKDCNKRLGITNGFECRCGLITCITHKIPIDHDCKIDYKKLEEDRLRKNNPLIIADKISGRI